MLDGRDAQAPSDVLIVVPTLGRRPEYLAQSLESIKAQAIPATVVIVGPRDNSELAEAAEAFGAELLPDPGSLPGAINLGVQEGGASHDFVTWLNDDDLLEPGSLLPVRDALVSNPRATVAYGSCRYINEDGKELWVNKAGRLAPWILKWGPDLIPQPGSLIRCSAWEAVGGLDESYGLAFDLDLLLRLQKLGPLIDVRRIVSSFRWHSQSLTVDDRHRNISESERAKRNALTPVGRKIAWAWEPPVRWATHLAAREVQRRARRLAGATTAR
jgi:GT2 family glycosyltransferase